MSNKINRIRIFEEIRDIPYRIPLTYGEYLEPDHCCEGKYKRFMKLAEKYNIKARSCVCDSLWSLLKLPKELYENPYEDYVGHIYPEVYIPERKLWIPVDPTWDIGLKDRYENIHINEWDGYNLTIVAFPPTKIYTVEESLESSLEKISPEEFEEDVKESSKFYKALNDWLEELRHK